MHPGRVSARGLPRVKIVYSDAQQLPWPARAAHSLDRGLCGSGLEGQPDARAVERGQPADRALLRHEDRADQLLPDVQPGRAAIRLQGARVQVPGAVTADGVRVLPRLRVGATTDQGWAKAQADLRGTSAGSKEWSR